MEDLLPCPFCESQNVRHREDGRLVECMDCGVQGPIGSDRGEARIKEFENAAAEKSFAFVDSKCPDCNGSGWVEIVPGLREVCCNRCHGTGLVGEYKEVPDIPRNPDDLSREFRKARERRKVPLAVLAPAWCMSVSRLSELETGIGEPRTAEEEKLMREWINGNNN